MGVIAKYKFNNTLEANLLPEFNSEFTSDLYTVTDEVNGEVTTRTIESDTLPTLMRFGHTYDSNLGATNITNSLVEVIEIDCSEITDAHSMFANCTNLTKVILNNFNKINDMHDMFYQCHFLTSCNTVNWNTSNVTDMVGVFSNCHNLTLLDLSNFNTSNVANMYAMFNGCNKLTSIDVSNFNTSNVTTMRCMFYGCTNLTTLDVSNFNTSKVTDMSNMFNNTFLLTDIGVLYMDKSSLQKLVNAMPTDLNKTLWYKDVDIDGVTHGNNIRLKKYIEENVEIVLNSPLLEGDRIEVKDGKLCHYHKMGMVVLDGSEEWTTWANSTNLDGYSNYYIYYDASVSGQYTLNVLRGKSNKLPLCDKLIGNKLSGNRSSSKGINSLNGYLTITLPHIELGINNNTTTTDRVNSFKQWLQANPTTVVYELETPYYEDITPLQSSLTLRTFNECNVQIITVLPIKTKITYRTNITSAIVMEQELDTLDSGVSLSNLIEEEVDE